MLVVRTCSYHLVFIIALLDKKNKYLTKVFVNFLEKAYIKSK